MPIKHLITHRHYRVAITSPTGELWAAHIQAFPDGTARVALFIKDEEAIDEAFSALEEAFQASIRDATGKLKPSDESYVWDWDLAQWKLAIALEPPPVAHDDSLPF